MLDLPIQSKPFFEQLHDVQAVLSEANRQDGPHLHYTVVDSTSPIMNHPNPLERKIMNIKARLEKNKKTIKVALITASVVALGGALVVQTRNLKNADAALLSYIYATEKAGLELDHVAQAFVKIAKTTK